MDLKKILQDNEIREENSYDVVAIGLGLFASIKSLTGIAERIVTAILPPIPLTLISLRNADFSSILAKPNNVIASSLTAIYVNILAKQPTSGNSKIVVSLTFNSKPTPLQLITTILLDFSTIVPSINENIFPIEFFINGEKCFGGDITSQELEDLSYENLEQRTGYYGSTKLIDCADMFKVRGWSGNDNFDATFVVSENGNVEIKKLD